MPSGAMSDMDRLGRIDMPLTDYELELAENCYGYGCWEAPYWFIGIEERLARIIREV